MVAQTRNYTGECNEAKQSKKKGSKHKAFCSRGGAYAQILREGHLYDVALTWSLLTALGYANAA